MPRKITGRGGAGRGQGRKVEMADGQVRPVTIKLDQFTTDVAKMIGGGNMSKGIRQAIRQVCRIRRINDQMLCGMPQCGIAYDVGDPDPPPCRMLVIKPLPPVTRRRKP